MRKESWIWLAMLAFALILASLFSCKQATRVERSIIETPVVVMDKDVKMNIGIYLPADTFYVLTLYNEGSSFPVEVSKKIYNKYSKGDTISKEVILTEYYYD